MLTYLSVFTVDHINFYIYIELKLVVSHVQVVLLHVYFCSQKTKETELHFPLMPASIGCELSSTNYVYRNFVKAY